MRKLLTVALLGASLALVACDTAEEATEPAVEDTTAAELPAPEPAPTPTDTATPEPEPEPEPAPAEPPADDY